MEIQLKETDGGELYFNLPDDVLERLGWQEGDELKFIESGRGFIIKKVRYESIELDFDKDELLRYMTYAHEQNITFNELCERAFKAMLNEVDSE